MAIKAIVFDYGGVVGSNFTWQQKVEELPDLSKFEGFHHMLRSAGNRWEAAKLGGETAPFWEPIASLCNKPVDDIRASFIDASRPAPEMINLVRKLRKNYKVALLSNHIKDWLEPLIKEYDLRSEFDEIVTSYETGLAKPDPKIYKIAAKRLGARCDEVLFVDDLENNLIPARELGMKTHLFRNLPDLLADLRANHITT